MQLYLAVGYLAVHRDFGCSEEQARVVQQQPMRWERLLHLNLGVALFADSVVMTVVWLEGSEKHCLVYYFLVHYEDSALALVPVAVAQSFEAAVLLR